MVTYDYSTTKRFIIGDIFAVGNSGAVLVSRKVVGLGPNEKPKNEAQVWIFDKNNEGNILYQAKRPIKIYSNSCAVFVPKEWIGKIAKVQILEDLQEEDKK